MRHGERIFKNPPGYLLNLRTDFPPVEDMRIVIQNPPMRSVTVAALFASFLACSTPLFAGLVRQSTSPDRERFISITHKLQEAPLDPTLRAERQWAMEWLIAAPDVSVNVCLSPLGGAALTNYSHFDEIIAQYTFAMADLVIERPETVNDPQAQQLAGVEGALGAYRLMLTADPQAKSIQLDKLLEVQSRGALPRFIRGTLSDCYKGKGEELHLR